MRSVEVKFATYQNLGTERSDDDTLKLIVIIRNKLLSLAGYEKSNHESPCSVFGSLYLPLATNLSPIKATPKATPTSTNQNVPKHYKVRKSPSKLGKRAIYNSTKKVLSSAVKSFGDKNALYYLESAVKKLQKKRDRSELEEEYEFVISDEDSEEESNITSLENDDRVIDAMSSFSVKNITYTEDDKTEILALFQIILSIAEEKKYKNCKRIAAETTSSILKGNAYYSNLTPRTITRWISVLNNTKSPTGPKINDEFEEEVWGKLMLCVFEKVPKFTSFVSFQI